MPFIDNLRKDLSLSPVKDEKKLQQTFSYDVLDTLKVSAIALGALTFPRLIADACLNSRKVSSPYTYIASVSATLLSFGLLYLGNRYGINQEKHQHLFTNLLAKDPKQNTLHYIAYRVAAITGLFTLNYIPSKQHLFFADLFNDMAKGKLRIQTQATMLQLVSYIGLASLFYGLATRYVSQKVDVEKIEKLKEQEKKLTDKLQQFHSYLSDTDMATTLYQHKLDNEIQQLLKQRFNELKPILQPIFEKNNELRSYENILRILLNKQKDLFTLQDLETKTEEDLEPFRALFNGDMKLENKKDIIQEAQIALLELKKKPSSKGHPGTLFSLFQHFNLSAAFKYLQELTKNKKKELLNFNKASTKSYDKKYKDELGPLFKDEDISDENKVKALKSLYEQLKDLKAIENKYDQAMVRHLFEDSLFIPNEKLHSYLSDLFKYSSFLSTNEPILDKKTLNKVPKLFISTKVEDEEKGKKTKVFNESLYSQFKKAFENLDDLTEEYCQPSLLDQINLNCQLDLDSDKFSHSLEKLRDIIKEKMARDDTKHDFEIIKNLLRHKIYLEKVPIDELFRSERSTKSILLQTPLKVLDGDTLNLEKTKESLVAYHTLYKALCQIKPNGQCLMETLVEDLNELKKQALYLEASDPIIDFYIGFTQVKP